MTEERNAASGSIARPRSIREVPKHESRPLLLCGLEAPGVPGEEDGVSLVISASANSIARAKRSSLGASPSIQRALMSEVFSKTTGNV